MADKVKKIITKLQEYRFSRQHLADKNLNPEGYEKESLILEGVYISEQICELIRSENNG